MSSKENFMKNCEWKLKLKIKLIKDSNSYLGIMLDVQTICGIDEQCT